MYDAVNVAVSIGGVEKGHGDENSAAERGDRDDGALQPVEAAPLQVAMF